MNTPVSESLALRSLAARLEGQQARLPSSTRLPNRLADAALVSQSITELGLLIAEMGQAIHTRIAVEPAPEHVLRTAWTYGQVVDRMGQAASALGAVTDQLATITHIAPLRGRPDADQALETANQVIEEAVATAHSEFAEAGQAVRTTVRIIDTQHTRAQAARARSAGAPAPAAPPAGAVAAAPPPAPTAARSR
ncbi:hypothetical protein P3T27_005904 [Kitasatospora sp. MAA19]|uniref:hypothetical protein n=1 Tax=unclassified Kitasatospora TaxID=2633591 RepID=UPI0024735FA3|nr:hypothetical protein [Kitasatospora sp. MAA19]MDH6709158.1 hypothetical protein [Kitasatospora sp. MAA19]